MRHDFAMAQRAANGVQRLMATHSEDEATAGEGRLVRFVFSDESVARDGHTIASKGWELDNFRANPVFLWCHDSSQPPIGRVVEVGVVGQRLMGTVDYADADTYAFADTIYRLTTGGYLPAVSVSWQPLEWKWSQDKGRPGGIDFKRQELLEVSAVPVPALPTALKTARAAGIDTRPLVEWAERVLDSGQSILVPRDELERLRRDAMEPRTMSKQTASNPWKVTASRNLPVSTEGDAIDVVEAINITDPKLLRKAFLVCSEDGATKRFAIASMRDGRLTVNAAAVRAVGKSIDASDLPDEVKAEARAVLEHYTAQIDGVEEETPKRKIGKRGLGTVGWLASLLGELGYLQECAEYEAEYEGDGSPIPQQLFEALKALGQILIDMTIEEVNEAIGEEAGEGSEVAEAVRAVRALRGLAPGQAQTRAGKVFSAANVSALEDVHASIDAARCNLRALIDGATTETRDDDGSVMSAAADDAEKRKRIAAAARARHQFESVVQETAS